VDAWRRVLQDEALPVSDPEGPGNWEGTSSFIFAKNKMDDGNGFTTM
jgi:hypothetical protein